MGKCEVGNDLPGNDAPCLVCGATVDERCKVAVKREAELIAQRRKEAADAEVAQKELDRKMMRDDKRTHSGTVRIV